MVVGGGGGGGVIQFEPLSAFHVSSNLIRCLGSLGFSLSGDVVLPFV